mgnify:CR=1 FL=1
MNKDLKSMLKRAERAGCVVTQGKHIKIMTPGGNGVPCPCSPKRPENAVRYVVQQLAKNGVFISRN